MTNTNSWRSSKAWFNAGKEHFNNAKSSLPTATKQTGINFVLTGTFAAAYHYETPLLKYPGEAAAVLPNKLGEAADWAAHKVGERTAVVQEDCTLQSKVTLHGVLDGNPVQVSYNLSPQKDEVDPVYVIENQKKLASICNRDNKPEGAMELKQQFTSEEVKLLMENHDVSLSVTKDTTKTQNVNIKNNQTKDWQTVGQYAEKASNVAVHLGTGIGLQAFSNVITTTGNSLLEGKGIKESFGDGVHAGRKTVHNAVWGIGEGVATVVDYGIGSTVLAFEGLGWLYNKAYDNTIGRVFPHDEAPVIAGAEVADADN